MFRVVAKTQEASTRCLPSQWVSWEGQDRAVAPPLSGREGDSQLPTGSFLRGPASILLYPSAPAPVPLTLGNLDVQGCAD